MLTTTKRPRRQPRQRRQHRAASPSPRVSRPRDQRPRLSREGLTRPTFSLLIFVRLTLFSRRPGRSRAPSDPRSRFTTSTRRSTCEHRAASRPRTHRVLLFVYSSPALRASLHTTHPTPHTTHHTTSAPCVFAVFARPNFMAMHHIFRTWDAAPPAPPKRVLTPSCTEQPSCLTSQSLRSSRAVCTTQSHRRRGWPHARTASAFWVFQSRWYVLMLLMCVLSMHVQSLSSPGSASARRHVTPVWRVDSLSTTPHRTSGLAIHIKRLT